MLSTKIKENVCGKMKCKCLLSVFLVTMVVLILGVGAPPGWAQDEFDVAQLFFELNNTDGDLGIHALIDGEPWKELEIEDKRGRDMLDVRVKGRLSRQGLTEIFFESAEPPFDELPPARFFRRFPEGIYTIEGETLDGTELENEVELTHVMPAPVGGIELNGESVVLEEVDCDVEDTIPEVAVAEDGSVTISWAPVTMSHPDADGGGAGVQPPVPVTIVNYEVVAEVELEVNGTEFTSKFSVILPPDVTEVIIPATFIAQSDEFKYEILAREESFNQTAIESCFVLEVLE